MARPITRKLKDEKQKNTELSCGYLLPEDLPLWKGLEKQEAAAEKLGLRQLKQGIGRGRTQGFTTGMCQLGREYGSVLENVPRMCRYKLQSPVLGKRGATGLWLSLGCCLWVEISSPVGQSPKPSRRDTGSLLCLRLEV